MATITLLSVVLVIILSFVSIHLWFVVRRLNGEVYVDALTGVSNRRAFDKAFEREIGFALRNRSPISILFIDVDHFGGVNRDYGHLVGDKLLRHIAQEINQTLHRRTDAMFRYGGEEFVILLHGTWEGGAFQKALEVNVAAKKECVFTKYNGDSLIVKCTVSIGWATLHAGEKPEQFLERANRAVRDAKNDGRNTIKPPLSDE